LFQNTFPNTQSIKTTNIQKKKQKYIDALSNKNIELGDCTFSSFSITFKSLKISNFEEKANSL